MMNQEQKETSCIRNEKLTLLKVLVSRGVRINNSHEGIHIRAWHMNKRLFEMKRCVSIASICLYSNSFDAKEEQGNMAKLEMCFRHIPLFAYISRSTSCFMHMVKDRLVRDKDFLLLLILPSLPFCLLRLTTSFEVVFACYRLFSCLFFFFSLPLFLLLILRSILFWEGEWFIDD